MFCKVNSTVTSCFCTSKWSTPVQTFTSKNTCVFVTNTFVLTIEVTNFASTNTDITSRHVCICTDVFAQLSHEALAKTHDFVVWFTFRIEVWSTFTTTDWLTSQWVFKDLFETKEFNDWLVYWWVETKTTFIRTNSWWELYTETTVYLYLTFIINPWYTEWNDTFWFNQTFQKVFFDIFRIFIEDRDKWIEDFFNCLKELSLVAVLSFHFFKNASNVFFTCCHINVSFQIITLVI